MAPVITAVNLDPLKGLLKENHDICTIEATVPTGFEDVACEECREKLPGVTCVVSRGRVFMDVEITRVPEILKFRSIDNVNVVIAMVKKFVFPDTREECFERLYKLAEIPDWVKGAQVWQQTVDYTGETIGEIRPLESDMADPRPDVDLKNLKTTSPILENLPQEVIPSHLKPQKGRADGKKEEKSVENEEQVNKPSGGGEVIDGREEAICEEGVIKLNLDGHDGEINDSSTKDGSERIESGPKFRISCTRTGPKHKFGSPEAARQFGAGVNEVLGWPVDLSNFDVEVLLCIDTDFVYVSICLTQEPLFKRNLTSFGPTNLRASLCYNLIRMAAPKPGEVILDPMCGGATIPMEGSMTYRSAFHLGGDNYGQAVKRSRENLDHHINQGCSLLADVARWDATRLPLRTQSVDAVVSDLPFGKRLGSQADNRVLYYRALVELARVTRVQTGRAVLLTFDKNSMMKTIKRVHTLWKTGASRTINIGGLAAVVYMLHRTSLLSDPSINIWEACKRRKEKLENQESEK